MSHSHKSWVPFAADYVWEAATTMAAAAAHAGEDASRHIKRPFLCNPWISRHVRSRDYSSLTATLTPLPDDWVWGAVGVAAAAAATAGEQGSPTL